MEQQTLHQTDRRGPPSRRRGRRRSGLQPTRGFSRVLAPRELWRYRDLAFQIAARDVTIRYRQTSFGAAWAILQPVAFMVVFSLIFGRSAGISSDGLPYALFSLAALVPWMFFANAFLLGSESLVINSGAGLENLLPAHLHAGRRRRRRLRRLRDLLRDPARHRPRLRHRPLARDPGAAAADRDRGGDRAGRRRRRSRRSTCATATSATWSPSRPRCGSSSRRSSTPAAASASRCGRSRRSTRWSAWSKASAGPCSTPAARHST